MSNKGEKSVSRRGLFREGVSYVRSAMDEFAQEAAKGRARADGQAGWNPLEVRRGVLRPPGAIDEERFVTLCKECDDCIKACPENTLRAAGEEHGSLEGTPIFDPLRKPCFLCSDLYCISACQKGALEPVETISLLDMGKARIDTSLCVSYEGDECRYCLDFCPLSGQAIIEIGGRPWVQAEQCVGCGLCQYHCYHEARRSAITVEPRVLNNQQ
ncbi:hypothetical protein MNBD_NITROSPINAE02-1707 [hydrothermal vent metagenome]|uniref:4Fe-4S ferredoxin-type domain-containing protein n=1 Tax=hydrothermal vent metagenome TaxID=652676 RepID=A0A3B1C7P9_9ZZZZ